MYAQEGFGEAETAKYVHFFAGTPLRIGSGFNCNERNKSFTQPRKNVHQPWSLAALYITPFHCSGWKSRMHDGTQYQHTQNSTKHKARTSLAAMTNALMSEGRTRAQYSG